MAGAGPAGGLLVQERQLTVEPVNAEGADSPRLLAAEIAHLAHRVKEALARMERQKAWVRGFRCQLGSAHSPGIHVEPRQVNAFALRSCVGPEIDKKLAAGRSGIGNQGGEPNSGSGDCWPNQVPLVVKFHAARNHKSGRSSRKALRVSGCQRGTPAFQAPSSKHQAPEKHQKTKLQAFGGRLLEFGAWRFYGASA